MDPELRDADWRNDKVVTHKDIQEVSNSLRDEYQLENLA